MVYWRIAFFLALIPTCCLALTYTPTVTVAPGARVRINGMCVRISHPYNASAYFTSVGLTAYYHAEMWDYFHVLTTSNTKHFTPPQVDTFEIDKNGVQVYGITYKDPLDGKVKYLRNWLHFEFSSVKGQQYFLYEYAQLVFQVMAKTYNRPPPNSYGWSESLLMNAVGEYDTDLICPEDEDLPRMLPSQSVPCFSMNEQLSSV